MHHIFKQEIAGCPQSPADTLLLVDDALRSVLYIADCRTNSWTVEGCKIEASRHSEGKSWKESNMKSKWTFSMWEATSQILL